MTQDIQITLDKIRLNLDNSQNKSSNLIQSWIYRKQVAVFDFKINQRLIAFDIVIKENNGLRIEVFCRGDSSNFLGTAGFSSIGSGRFLVREISNENNTHIIEEEASKSILKAIDQIVNLGRHPSDVILVKSLGVISPLVVVDVGANDLSEPPYAPLREVGLCKIVGFEPQQHAFDELQKNKTDDECYFPYAIGADETIELNIYSYSGFTSSYKIDEDTINIHKNWRSGTRLKETLRIKCHRLDDVPKLPQFDLLKIDIQGGELNVFRNAKESLSSAICVITEVGFFPLYEKAPSFGDIHLELLDQGFFLHKFLHQVHINVSELDDTGAQIIAKSSQIMDGDAVYIRDYRNVENLSTENIKKYALMGHFVFGSEDFVVRMMGYLVQRGEIGQEAVDSYVASLLS